MSDPTSKYKSYNFPSDQKYQEYLSSLYPTPSYEKLEKLRRKWYKKYIDHDLDIDFDDNKSQQQQQQQQQSSSSQQSQQQDQQVPPAPNANITSKDIMLKVEGMAKVFYFPALIFGQDFMAKILIIVVSLLQIIRNKGMIKFNAEYAATVFPTEFLGNIIYAIALMVPPGRVSFLWFLPISLNMLTGVAQFMISTSHIAYQKVAPLKKLLDWAQSNRGHIIIMKQKIEIYLLFYTLIGFFFGLSSFLQIILMVQYIGLKNKVNRNMQNAHRELIYKVQGFISLVPVPAVRNILQKILFGYQKLLSFI